MVKYYCNFCKTDLFHSRLSGRRMHNNGWKHNMIKKTFFLELFEDKNIKKELECFYKQFDYEAYKLKKD